MKKIASEFCESHGISVPHVRFRRLPFGTLATHGFNKFHEGVITVDVSQGPYKYSFLNNFLHELMHQWQKQVIGPGWYDLSDELLLRQFYPGRLRRFFRRPTFMERHFMYLNTAIEVEARSFARSMEENLRCQ